MSEYHTYKVSEKSITVRMYIFLDQILPKIYAGVENKKDKEKALEQVKRIHCNLLRGVEDTPQNTVDTYKKSFETACLAIEMKDI